MELIVRIEEPAWSYLKSAGIVILCLIIGLFAIFINLNRRKRNKKPLSSKERMQTGIAIFGLLVGLVICINFIYIDVLYVFDYWHQNSAEVTDNIEHGRLETRDNFRIYTEEGIYIVPNYDYTLDEYIELSGYIVNNFVGYECEIEYYKLSKFVKKIKVIK